LGSFASSSRLACSVLITAFAMASFSSCDTPARRAAQPHLTHEPRAYKPRGMDR
jgi:hypothetical protein